MDRIRTALSAAHGALIAAAAPALIASAAATAVAAAAVAVAPAQAQELSATLGGQTSPYTGSSQLQLLHGEVTAVIGGTRLAPVLSVRGSAVSNDLGDRDTDYALNPSLGLRARVDGGFFQVTAGYSFRGEGQWAPLAPHFGGGAEGMTTGVRTEYRGASAGLEGTGSYNFGSEYLSTVVRGMVHAVDARTGNLQLGLEFGWMGELSDEFVVDDIIMPGRYSSWQAGPMARWTTGPLAATLAGGLKTEPFNSDRTWYVGLELSAASFGGR